MTDAIAGGAPVEPLARYFEYWLLRLQGVYPSLRRVPAAREPLHGRRGDAAARRSVRLPELRRRRAASASAWTRCGS